MASTSYSRRALLDGKGCMKDSSSPPKSKKEALHPIIQSNKGLAYALRQEVRIYDTERTPLELKNLVYERGFDGLLRLAFANDSKKKWNTTSSKLRSIRHLVEKGELDFLECWLRVCEQQASALNLLYDRKKSFIRPLWRRGPGTVLFQIEQEMIHSFAWEGDLLALASTQGVSLFSFQTGERYSRILLNAVQDVCFVDGVLFILCPDVLYSWNGEECSVHLKQCIQKVSSYAGWIAIHEDCGSLTVLDECLSMLVPHRSTVLSFCHEGLSVAMGTEDGTVLLCHENALHPQAVHVSSGLPITAIFWESKLRMWFGDEEGRVWFWNGEQCSFWSQYHSKVMEIGRCERELVVVTVNGVVGGKGMKMYIPEPFSVCFHDAQGVMGLFAHHRFCHIRPSLEQGLEAAFLLHDELWLFSDVVECISISDIKKIYTDSVPSSLFVAMEQNIALDVCGGLWSFSSRWNKVARCQILDHQKSWFHGQNVFVLGGKGLQVFLLDGTEQEYDKNVLMSTKDGKWRLLFDGTLNREGVFIRHFVHLPTYILSVHRNLVVIQEAVISVLDGEEQIGTYVASDMIVSVDIWREFVAVACKDHSIMVLNLKTGLCAGRYSVSGSIKKIQIGARMRMMLHMADGSVELIMLDGIQR